MSTDLALRTHLAVVARTVQLTPRVRRVTFAGDDLSDYRTVGPDDFLYLLLPPPGRTELTVDRDFDWVSYFEMPEEDRPVGANYTVRHRRPERGEIDIDFVLHHDPGPASGWAELARPGDPVALWGPRTTWRPPADVDGYLLVADETGLPATAAILEHLALDHLAGRFDGPVRVVVEIADAAEEQPLGGCARRRSPGDTASLDLLDGSAGEDDRELSAPPPQTLPGQNQGRSPSPSGPRHNGVSTVPIASGSVEQLQRPHLAGREGGPGAAGEPGGLAGRPEGPGLPDLDVTWLHRGPGPAGTTTALVDAVAALDLPSGAPYVWGGGESRSMTRIRMHVRHRLGLPRERVSLTGYWRHPAHAGDPEEDPDEDEEHQGA